MMDEERGEGWRLTYRKRERVIEKLEEIIGGGGERERERWDGRIKKEKRRKWHRAAAIAVTPKPTWEYTPTGKYLEVTCTGTRAAYVSVCVCVCVSATALRAKGNTTIKAISQDLRRWMSLFKTTGGTFTVENNLLSSDTLGEIPNVGETSEAFRGRVTEVPNTHVNTHRSISSH